MMDEIKPKTKIIKQLYNLISIYNFNFLMFLILYP